jgi:hypothetical protein
VPALNKKTSFFLQFGLYLSFTPRPFYPRRKSPLYSLDRRLGGPQNRSGLCGEEKHLAPAGNSTRALQPQNGPKRKPPHCCLRAAAEQQMIYLAIVNSLRTDPKETTTPLLGRCLVTHSLTYKHNFALFLYIYIYRHIRQIDK